MILNAGPLGLGLLLLLGEMPIGAQISPRLYTVELSAITQTSPPKITLKWPGSPDATGYTISRKSVPDSLWIQVAALPGSVTEWTDQNVTLPSAFEYQILKSTSGGYTGTGYVYAGLRPIIPEKRGKVLLLVDKTWSSQLAVELTRLGHDLVGDGWTVLRQDVERSATPPQVKTLIKSLYTSELKSVFIFGHVAVPYSGDYAPDGHFNHRGAWPADTYYADMDGEWTDLLTTSVTAEREENHNVPGDGKFDQSEIPSDLELQIGRVDLFNLQCFANVSPPQDELWLLRQYLNKNHRYRHGKLLLTRRGLVCDNFGGDSEALASSGWRNFAPFFHAANNREIAGGTFFSTLASNGYLWAYGNGGGSYTSCNGIGTSEDFVTYDIKAVFTMFFGSYYGDWDNESNFLRAALGSKTYVLASLWAYPHWFMHHMGLGETIGYSTLLTQNNRDTYVPQNPTIRGVHISLMGDPTLRMHVVLPPKNQKATYSTGVRVTWDSSLDTALRGYFVYRGPSLTGPYTRLTSKPVLDNFFDDPAGTLSSVYMIRAVKLETTGSGTYFNMSQGVYARVSSTPPPAVPSELQALASSDRINLSWRDNSNNEEGFHLYRKTSQGSYSRLATVPQNNTTYSDATALSGQTYYYYATSYSAVGESAPSNEANATVGAGSSATFTGLDTTTLGNWKGIYGSDGFNVIHDTFSYPSGVSVVALGNQNWVWEWNTLDPSALQRAADPTRLAACWFSDSQFDLKLWIQDADFHQVAFYCLDWDFSGRILTIEILDAATSALLDARTISNFGEGVYLVWQIKGNVVVRFKKVTGNAVVSGFFFDPTPPPP